MNKRPWPYYGPSTIYDLADSTFQNRNSGDSHPYMTPSGESFRYIESDKATNPNLLGWRFDSRQTTLDAANRNRQAQLTRLLIISYWRVVTTRHVLLLVK